MTKNKPFPLVISTALAAILFLFAAVQAIAETVNINKADAATLQYIQGVGEVRAKAIVKYRKKYGSFKSLDDVMNVDGIGEKTLKKIKKTASTSRGASSLSASMKEEMGSRPKSTNKKKSTSKKKKASTKKASSKDKKTSAEKKSKSKAKKKKVEKPATKKKKKAKKESTKAKKKPKKEKTKKKKKKKTSS